MQTDTAALASRLLKRALPYTTEDFVGFRGRSASIPRMLPHKPIVCTIEKEQAGAPAEVALKEALERFRALLDRDHNHRARQVSEVAHE